MAIPLRKPGTPKRSEDASAGTGTSPVAPSTSTTSEVRGQLTVVPARRRFAWVAVTLSVLVSAGMIGAIGLHTRIAERQLQIDALERSVRGAQEDFDVLRSQRAQLRSPTRIAAEASSIGMVVGSESEFVAVDPMTLAVTIARTGHDPVDAEVMLGANQDLEPLDQFRLVKRVSSETP